MPNNDERSINQFEDEFGAQHTSRVDVRLKRAQYAWLLARAEDVRVDEQRNVTISEMVRDAIDYWIDQIVAPDWVERHPPAAAPPEA